MTEFTVESFEPGLWTVGFNTPAGKWEPESDHDSERDAQAHVDDLNGVRCDYVYMRTEPGLWTVGYYHGDRWEPESDHSSADAAADRVMELNR